MNLGNFSISLASARAFYDAFGFKTFVGNAAQSWLILKNHVIG